MKTKKYDILVVGDLNVDLIMNKINKMPQIGKEQRADEMHLTMGGSTAIFACNISKLGTKTGFMCKLGQDSFGRFLIQKIKESKVGTEYIIVDPDLSTGATIIFFIENDRMMVTYPGAMEHLSADEISDEILNSVRHIHTSAIFFQPLLKKGLADLFERARKLGLSTSMDTQWDPEENWNLDLEEILPHLDFFLPNEDEFLRLTGEPDLESALQSVAHHETCFVIKRSKNGALMYQNNDKTTVKSLPVTNIIDSIGAGDSFNAGFIHAFLDGKNTRTCLVEGNRTAAVSMTAAGGVNGIISYSQVLEKAGEFEELLDNL